ncbi:MAG: hypothetical protein OJF50_003345 [Nitrospira sp.]|jgi:MerR family mercuric resistance operon transcriptional regulator|nr:hypothetical protein [Nitrospira sp.]
MESSGNFNGSGINVGKVAKLAEVNVETIRYYQRLGLLAEPDKPYWDTAAIRRTS